MAKIGEFQWKLQIAIKLTFLVRISPNMVCMEYIQQNFQKSETFSISLFFGDVTAKNTEFLVIFGKKCEKSYFCAFL